MPDPTDKQSPAQDAGAPAGPPSAVAAEKAPTTVPFAGTVATAATGDTPPAAAAPGGNPASAPPSAPAASPSPQQHRPAPGGDQEHNRLDQLRQLREIVQYLREHLEQVRSGSSTITEKAADLDPLRDDGDRIISALAPSDDESQKILNLWRTIRTRITSQGANPADQQLLLRRTSEAIESCGKLIRALAIVTIPARLDEWMIRNPPGYAVSFRRLFKDELPDDDGLQELLVDIATQQNVLTNALVSPRSGLVYSYSPSATLRWLSLFSVLPLVAITALIPIGVCLIAVPGLALTRTDWPNVFTRWVLVLLGALGHVVIDKVKARSRHDTDPGSFSIADLPAWANALLGPIIWKLAATLLGLAILLTMSGVKCDLFSAFLVGYSLDSVIGAFGDSVDKRSLQYVEKVKASG